MQYLNQSDDILIQQLRDAEIRVSGYHVRIALCCVFEAVIRDEHAMLCKPVTDESYQIVLYSIPFHMDPFIDPLSLLKSLSNRMIGRKAINTSFSPRFLLKRLMNYLIIPFLKNKLCGFAKKHFILAFLVSDKPLYFECLFFSLEKPIPPRLLWEIHDSGRLKDANLWRPAVRVMDRVTRNAPLTLRNLTLERYRAGFVMKEMKGGLLWLKDMEFQAEPTPNSS